MLEKDFSYTFPNKDNFKNSLEQQEKSIVEEFDYEKFVDSITFDFKEKPFYCTVSFQGRPRLVTRSLLLL